LHILLVLGAIWFWTQRPAVFRPLFRSGEISLAVTFVRTEDGGQTAEDGGQTPEQIKESEERKTEDEGQRAEDRGQTAEDGEQKTEDEPVAAFSQGVNAAVRMKTEIRPYYPIGARLRGEEGAVTLRVAIDNSGRVFRCEVTQSSGYPALDNAAMEAARKACYVSTQPDAWSAENETMLTFRFRLTE
jgi:TonB family protein